MQMAHVTIMTKCLDESVKFYEKELGLSIIAEMRANSAQQIVFLGDKSGGTHVELIANPDAAYTGSGISMGFAIENIDQEYAKKKDEGLAVGPMISPNPKTKFFFVKDPNGVDIQFIQQA